VSAGKVGGAARIVLGLLYPRRLQRHITPQGAGAATGPVKLVVEALRRLDWGLDTGGRLQLDRLHIRVHLWWVSRWIRRLLVVTGARCPLTKPVVAAVEQQATTEPHCSRGVQPGGICVYVGAACSASRPPEARGRACSQAASASYASCRSGSIVFFRITLSKPRTANSSRHQHFGRPSHCCVFGRN
jgi:hypothetical protein